MSGIQPISTVPSPRKRIHISFFREYSDEMNFQNIFLLNAFFILSTINKSVILLKPMLVHKGLICIDTSNDTCIMEQYHDLEFVMRMFQKS
jgi:hypothetical protein